MNEPLRTYRVHTFGGVNFEVQSTLPCPAFANVVRAHGYIQTDSFYVPHHAIVGIVDLSTMTPQGTLLTTTPQGMA